MSSVETELEVLYRIGNAAVREYPFPHLYLPGVFPDEFYADIRRNLPPQSAMRTLGQMGRIQGGDYPERGVLPMTQDDLARLDPPQRAFWEQTAQWLLGRRFFDLVVGKFAPYLAHRFGDLHKVRFHHEALIVRDRTNYSLGPHTDAPHKVLSLLFYLPPDSSNAHLGTSIYLPRDPAFVCQGGPHYEFDKFQRLQTMPYLPNTLFAFMKTPNAFHGVEPISEQNVARDLLLYDIRGTTQQSA